MRLSCVILPIHPWRQAREIWQRAEQLGLHAAYTYDHVSFEGFEDVAWYAAIPTLAAAATATARIRLGPMITSPNLRHPVTLAKDLMTIDSVSEGRLTVGIGAGSSGLDASVLGQRPWTPAERADRFDEFVTALDRLLTGEHTSLRGQFYSAKSVRACDGVQKPRPPFVIAGSGPRGMKLAAEYAQGWVTCPFLDDTHTVAEVRKLLRAEVDRLERACAERHRDPSTLDKAYLSGFTPENPLASVAAFEDTVGECAGMGFTELIVHWPVPNTRFANNIEVLEQVTRA